MTPDPVSRELTVASLHPGVTREQVQAATGWDIRFVNDVGATSAPSERELAVLRDLLKRTADAHGSAA